MSIYCFLLKIGIYLVFEPLCALFKAICFIERWKIEVKLLTFR